MSKQRVVIHPDDELLSEAVAVRLLTRLIDVQAERSPIHVVLTGGTVGIETLRAVSRSRLLGAIDWTNVHFWWGDERYVAANDSDRNDLQAREALLNLLVAQYALPDTNIHAIPAAVEGNSVEQAAQEYAAELARFADDSDLEVPIFDVLMLGMGPDAHIASLFPGHDALHASGTTVAVFNSPKPPSIRVSLTFAAINTASEVWLVAAGDAKAEAVRAALNGAPLEQAPAGHVHGRKTTLWLIDAQAASLV